MALLIVLSSVLRTSLFQEPLPAEWDRLLQNLRSGGNFENINLPEYHYFQAIKKMGLTAYPLLIASLGDEDPAISLTAATVLNALTGKDVPLPHDDTRAAVQALWREWLVQERKRLKEVSLQELVMLMTCSKTEAEVRGLIGALSADDFDVRLEAVRQLRTCALRHAPLLRLAIGDRDLEVRLRLQPIVEDIPCWEEQAQRVERHPELLTEFLKKGDLNVKEGEEFRKRVEALCCELKKKLDDAHHTPP